METTTMIKDVEQIVRYEFRMKKSIRDALIMNGFTIDDLIQETYYRLLKWPPNMNQKTVRPIFLSVTWAIAKMIGSQRSNRFLPESIEERSYEMPIIVDDIYDLVDTKSADILRMYINGISFEDIAKKYGCTRQWISVTVKKTLEFLRRNLS